MATRNITPRATGEGGLGVAAKHWGTAYIDNMFGALTGTAAFATTSGQAGTSFKATSAGNAGTAYLATSALNAGYATTAGQTGTAYKATSAAQAGSAGSATTAAQAGTASYATTAANAGTATTQPDNDSTTQIATTAFAKSQDAVLHREPDQAVNMTAAASGSSGITVADNANINFGTGNFTLCWKGSLPDWTPATVSQILMTKHQDSSNRVLFQVRDTDHFLELYFCKTGGTLVDKISTIKPPVVDGTVGEIVAVITRETAATAGSVSFYVNGVLLETLAISAGTPADISNTGNLYIGGNSSLRTASTTHHAYTLNFAPTAAEVLDLYRNGVIFANKWGNVTELMPNVEDRDFSAASAWANVDLFAYDETGDLTITASAAAQYCTCPVASAPTTIGKTYRMSFDVANIVSTWTMKSFNGTQTIGTVTANGTGQKIEWTASTTGGYRIVAASTTSSGDFDNFTLVEIGATLALLPENIGLDKWYDSANGLDATYPAVGASLTRPLVKTSKQPTPTAKTTAATLTIAELLTGIVTGTHAAGATQAYTLPTGALTEAGGTFTINTYFDWCLINLSAAAADTITVTAAATGHAIVGNPIVQSAHATTGGIYGNSSIWRTRKTGASTFVSYRIA